jgi:hypothetical protein
LPHIQFSVTKTMLKMRVLETHTLGFETHRPDPRDQLIGRWRCQTPWQLYD